MTRVRWPGGAGWRSPRHAGPRLRAAGLALGVLATLVPAVVAAQTPVASIVAPPSVVNGASVPFIVSIDPPPEHRTDVLLLIDQVGAGVADADLGRRSLVVGPAGYAHLPVATQNDGIIGADGRIRALLVGGGNAYVASRTHGSATVQVRDARSASSAPVISLAAPRSVAEGAAVVVLLSASSLPSAPIDVELAVRSTRVQPVADTTVFEEIQPLTWGRDGFAQLVVATEDNDSVDPDGLTVVELLPSSAGDYRVSHSAGTAEVAVLDDDWVSASDPYPTLSIVAPEAAPSGAETAFIITANPPPPPGQVLAVPLLFQHAFIDAAPPVADGEDGEEEEEEDTQLRFEQTGGGSVIAPRALNEQLPVAELWQDGLAYVSFTPNLVGRDPGWVQAAIVGSAEGAYRVSEAHGQARVRVFGADGTPAEPVRPQVSIRAPTSSHEGQRARFLLRADPVGQPGETVIATVRVALAGESELTPPADCRADEEGLLCPVLIDDAGWGLLEILVRENTQPSDGARLTATVVLNPLTAAYVPVKNASLR